MPVNISEIPFRAAIIASCLLVTGSGLVAEDAVSAGKAAAENGKQTYLLRYKFHDGEQLRYDTHQVVTMQTVSTAGQKTDFSKTEHIRVFTVSDVTDQGSATAKMQYASVRAESRTNDDEPIVFESSMKKDEIPRWFRSFAEKLKSAAPTFELLPEGLPVSKDGEENPEEKGIACFLIALPKEPVVVGESWSTKLAINVRLAPGIKRKIQLLRSYKLRSVTDGLAEIVMYTSVASPVKSINVKAQLLQATPKGIVKFDIRRGRVVRKELSSDKSVLGALGPNTALSATVHVVEKLLTDDAVANTSTE